MKPRILLIWSFQIVLLLGAAPAVAGEGRIPIYEPHTTIDQSGSYVVTCDLVATTSAPVIEIRADYVDIDVNGWELRCGPPPCYAFYSAPGDRIEQLRIRNGHIVNGDIAIHNAWSVWVEDLRLKSSYSAGPVTITLRDVDDFTVRRNVIKDGFGINVGPNGGFVTGSIEHNFVLGGGKGIYVHNGKGVELLHNHIREVYSPAIELSAVNGSLVAQNTIYYPLFDGVHVYQSRGNKYWNNVILHARRYGIYSIWSPSMLGSSDSYFLDNLVAESDDDGVFIEGPRNYLYANVMNANGDYGLRFQTSSVDNVYAHNFIAGNTVADYQDGGTGNDDLENNVMDADSDGTLDLVCADCGCP
jgi:nitrous oxidase accessory protein NosD